MAQILIERGYDATLFTYGGPKLSECPKFQCVDQTPTSQCCTRRILFNQPDFQAVPSLLEDAMRPLGIEVIFLPKFHCELNPIEQCWGYAKRIYRMNPESSLEAELEKNAVAAIDSVPLETVRRYFNRSHRFVDAYRRGLSAKQSIWACKKYRGHRVLPPSIMEELSAAKL